MIDSHSHIYLKDFDEDRNEVLTRAEEAGVSAILMPSIDFDSLKQMENLSHPRIKFYKMAGIHPCDVENLEDGYEIKLLDLCKQEGIIAVGETGLDYYWSKDFVVEQKLSLHAHCRVAKKVNKPIVLHNRDSTEDLLKVIESEQDGSLRGVWHCFNGTAEEGKKAIELGFYLGIGGVVTFKNGGVDKTVAQLPLDKMILETDAPYLSPAPMRGKRNEPAFMKYTAEKLADIFGLTIEDVARQTNKNSRLLFKIF